MNMEFTLGIINMSARGLLTSILVDGTEKEKAGSVRLAEYYRRQWQAAYPASVIEVHRILLGSRGGWKFV